MIVIADSGSSKTDWLIFDKAGIEISRKQTIGLNPFHVSTSEITDLVQNTFKNDSFVNEIEKIFFYGAGCSAATRKSEILLALKVVFFKAKINIESDILGAARALFFDKEGVAIILGTGSNTVFYDGKKIVKSIQSLGYQLGDEGSGAVIGRKILQAYFRKELDIETEKKLNESFDLRLDKVLENLYKHSAPNRYMASFAKFAGENIDNIKISNLVAEVFQDYFKYQFASLNIDKSVKIGLVGSIAFHFQKIFCDIAEENSIFIEKILRHPIESLKKFHLTYDL
ncbi:MAG: hypothetical protein AUJ98_08280 [Bacteroidetes bacterium CG2_30_33_31]|nr:MAG: hypothetical protein AUJ98_08280 [Bacteroidetes bacterium CG2_30_33_31]